MGVINEDNRGKSFRNMIDKHGLYYAIKLMGGFDYSMEDYISKEDKITFIKEKVNEPLWLKRLNGKKKSLLNKRI